MLGVEDTPPTPKLLPMPRGGLLAAQQRAVPATHHASDATMAALWGIDRTLSAMVVQIYKKITRAPVAE